MKYFTTLSTTLMYLLCLGLPAMTAQAQAQLSLGELAQGQLALNLSINEQASVEQDTLNINLQYVTQGRDRIDIQDEVNRIIKGAVDELRKNPAFDFNTSHYMVQILQTGRPTRTDLKDPVFRAQQGIQIHSLDSAALLELTGKLQAMGLTMNSMYYSLSDELHEATSATLTRQALLKLQSRAQDAAQILGKSSAQLVEVNMDASANFKEYQPRAVRGMAAMMSEDTNFDAPTAEPGESVVSVNVSGRAILSP